MIKHLLKLVWNRKRANALLVAEILVSFLVIFAVLAGVTTFASSWSRPLGFNWQDVHSVRMDLTIDGRGRESQELRDTVFRMIDEAKALPQVAAVAVSNTPPYAFSTNEMTLGIEEKPVSFVSDDVSDEFASVMRLKLIRGRFFTREDDAMAHQPIVLDETAARSIWGSADPIGKRFEIGEDRFAQVVGVVQSYREDGETAAPRNVMFTRLSRDGKQGRLGSNLVVRLHPGTPAAFEEELVARLQAVAPGLSFRVRSMEQMRDRALRMRLAPLVVGGIIALFLISMVALGLTGVLWQSVTKRTREIGLRRAMGATGGNVHRQILGEIVLLTAIALIVGVIVVLQLPLLGIFTLVTPAAFTVGIVAALATILVLTVVCGLYPSWLASRLTPSDALRYE